MKCPNCGSERIQFGTNTKGSGYSAGNACCGFIFLGPLGLLCGACGSDVSTEEFWICQECGNKFTNKEAKKYQEQEKEIKRNYEQSKRDSEKAIQEYGSKEAIQILLRKSEDEKNKHIKIFNEYVDKYITENFSDPNISKWIMIVDSNYSKIEVAAGILLAIFTLLSFIGESIGTGILGVILILGLIIARPLVSFIYNRKLIRYIVEKDEQIKKMFYKAKQADDENKKYCIIMNKINSCEEYEKKQQHG